MYLYIGGETSGESRFSNLKTGSMFSDTCSIYTSNRILLVIQILMEATNGLGVILENRFYGESWPYEDSTTDNLRYSTNEQSWWPFPYLRYQNLNTVAIADNAYFAQHVNFPGVTGNLTAPHTPWILYGGSLAGAETAFSVKTYGDILFGGIAASGIVNVKLEYPQW